MPELPEVETTRRGIAPLVEGQEVTGVVTRQPRLRWLVPEFLPAVLPGQRLRQVARRAKYLLLRFDRGTLVLHLGMSGSLRVVQAHTPPAAHDHFDLVLGNRCLRLRDPRRFGAVLWTEEPPETHPLLRHLGPEPLSADFSGEYLYQRSRGRHAPVKSFIMNNQVVVGVGNIYASEALFAAGIHPGRAAGRISLARYRRLAESIQTTLESAIGQGGTTLRDFQQVDGNPGYFVQSLQVYGRAGAACPRCGGTIRQRVIGQRSSYYCPGCQR